MNLLKEWEKLPTLCFYKTMGVRAMSKHVVALVEEMAMPIIESEGYELVEVEYVKEGKNWFLRIYIDKPGGVNLDDCQKVSEYVGEKLDEADAIKENYYLEVSSPGLDRKLKRERDFQIFAGRDVELSLYKPVEGEKHFEGELIGLFEGDIIKINSNGNMLEFNRKDVAVIKLAVKF